MRLVGGNAHLKAQGLQMCFHTAAQFLSVLQGARRVKSLQASRFNRSALQFRFEQGNQVRQQLTDVFGQGADALGFVGIGRIVFERVAIEINISFALSQINL